MMRNINVVIEKMKSLSTNEDFKKQLGYIQEKSAYLAPERMYELWDETHLLLCETYPKPTWDEESIEIYMEFTTMSRHKLFEVVNSEGE